MSKMDEHILRATKEIVVKFIETGRLSPTTFHESFQQIYETVENAAKGSGKEKEPEPADKEQGPVDKE